MIFSFHLFVVSYTIESRTTAFIQYPILSGKVAVNLFTWPSSIKAAFLCVYSGVKLKIENWKNWKLKNSGVEGFSVTVECYSFRMLRRGGGLLWKKQKLELLRLSWGEHKEESFIGDSRSIETCRQIAAEKS